MALLADPLSVKHRRCCPRAGDAIGIGKSEDILTGLIAAADGDGGAFHIGVINIGDGEGPVDDGCAIAFGVGEGGARIRDHGGIIGIRDGNGGCDARGVDGPIVDHPSDGPIGVVRVIGVGVLIGDALEGGLVVGFAGRAAQRQDTATAVPRAGDAIGIGKSEDILTGLIAAADGDGGAFHIGVINIGDGEGPVDDGCAIAFGVGEGGARIRDHGGIIGIRDGNGGCDARGVAVPSLTTQVTVRSVLSGSSVLVF